MLLIPPMHVYNIATSNIILYTYSLQNTSPKCNNILLFVNGVGAISLKPFIREAYSNDIMTLQELLYDTIIKLRFWCFILYIFYHNYGRTRIKVNALRPLYRSLSRQKVWQVIYIYIYFCSRKLV